MNDSPVCPRKITLLKEKIIQVSTLLEQCKKYKETNVQLISNNTKNLAKLNAVSHQYLKLLTEHQNLSDLVNELKKEANKYKSAVAQSELEVVQLRQLIDVYKVEREEYGREKVGALEKKLQMAVLEHLHLCQNLKKPGFVFKSVSKGFKCLFPREIKKSYGNHSTVPSPAWSIESGFESMSSPFSFTEEESRPHELITPCFEVLDKTNDLSSDLISEKCEKVMEMEKRLFQPEKEREESSENYEVSQNVNATRTPPRLEFYEAREEEKVSENGPTGNQGSFSSSPPIEETEVSEIVSRTASIFEPRGISEAVSDEIVHGETQISGTGPLMQDIVIEIQLPVMEENPIEKLDFASENCVPVTVMQVGEPEPEDSVMDHTQIEGTKDILEDWPMEENPCEHNDSDNEKIEDALEINHSKVTENPVVEKSDSFSVDNEVSDEDIAKMFQLFKLPEMISEISEEMVLKACRKKPLDAGTQVERISEEMVLKACRKNSLDVETQVQQISEETVLETSRKKPLDAETQVQPISEETVLQKSRKNSLDAGTQVERISEEMVLKACRKNSLDVETQVQQISEETVLETSRKKPLDAETQVQPISEETVLQKSRKNSLDVETQVQLPLNEYFTQTEERLCTTTTNNFSSSDLVMFKHFQMFLKLMGKKKRRRPKLGQWVVENVNRKGKIPRLKKKPGAFVRLRSKHFSGKDRKCSEPSEDDNQLSVLEKDDSGVTSEMVVENPELLIVVTSGNIENKEEDHSPVESETSCQESMDSISSQQNETTSPAMLHPSDVSQLPLDTELDEPVIHSLRENEPERLTLQTHGDNGSLEAAALKTLERLNKLDTNFLVQCSEELMKDQSVEQLKASAYRKVAPFIPLSRPLDKTSYEPPKKSKRTVCEQKVKRVNRKSSEESELLAHEDASQLSAKCSKVTIDGDVCRRKKKFSEDVLKPVTYKDPEQPDDENSRDSDKLIIDVDLEKSSGYEHEPKEYSNDSSEDSDDQPLVKKSPVDSKQDKKAFKTSQPIRKSTRLSEKSPPELKNHAIMTKSKKGEQTPVLRRPLSPIDDKSSTPTRKSLRLSQKKIKSVSDPSLKRKFSRLFDSSSEDETNESDPIKRLQEPQILPNPIEKSQPEQETSLTDSAPKIARLDEPSRSKLHETLQQDNNSSVTEPSIKNPTSYQPQPIRRVARSRKPIGETEPQAKNQEPGNETWIDYKVKPVRTSLLSLANIQPPITTPPVPEKFSFSFEEFTERSRLMKMKPSVLSQQVVTPTKPPQRLPTPPVSSIPEPKKSTGNFFTDIITNMEKPPVIPVFKPVLDFTRGDKKKKKSKKNKKTLDKTVKQVVVPAPTFENKDEEIAWNSLESFLNAQHVDEKSAALAVKTCIAALDKISDKILVKTVVNVVKENVDEHPDLRFTPPAPPLTPTQQRLFALRSAYKRLQDLSMDISDEIYSLLLPERFIWQDDTIESCAMFLGALYRQTDDVTGALQFCVDVASQMRQRGCLVLNAVLAAWPEIMPLAQNADPWGPGATLALLVMSTPLPTREKQQNGLRKLKSLLNGYYGYEREVDVAAWTRKAIDALRKGDLVASRPLSKVALICPESSIVSPLLESLGVWEFGGLSDCIACKMLDILRVTMKAHMKERKRKKFFHETMQRIGEILLAKKVSFAGQEAIVNFISSFSRKENNFTSIFEQWIPDEAVSEEVHRNMIAAIARSQGKPKNNQQVLKKKPKKKKKNKKQNVEVS